ncbi:hypothetical protein [Catalinimonas alkaloidigena]|uniref:hypothetical protein n=1 Tax=Catalinimonas alkaloidigena TaxID=1075417 RepID=UPI000B7E3196|nr:hypothetical protein [Catalinimonas alkaloidigena]
MTAKKRTDVSFVLKVLTLFFLLALGMWKNQDLKSDTTLSQEGDLFHPFDLQTSAPADAIYGEVTATAGTASPTLE